MKKFPPFCKGAGGFGRAKVEPEDFVMVLGCGPIGFLALQIADDSLW
jgi:threonine dehydrogenase-like Zn-dependent dehydrogenase